MERSILLSKVNYNAPIWIKENINSEMIPKSRVILGRFPTPIHKFHLEELDEFELELWLKRDDSTSFDLGGNKVRKLEFLQAQALEGAYDCTITIGGSQSNHARATAISSRQLGLQSYLVLRTDSKPENIGLVGNLLFDRLVGSTIKTVTPEEYHELGGPFFTNNLACQLRNEGKNPFIIPVGGSNPTGSFGYLDFVEELIIQTRSCLNNSNDNYFDHIIFACGSGGTATGIALGVRLSGISAKVHAIGVCDTPDEFYDHMEESATALGINFDKFGKVRDWCNIYDGQGEGYAISSKEELEYITSVSNKTGVIFDPVYSGKALFSLKNVISNNRHIFLKGHKVLFVHTGGVLGFYDKIDTLMSILPNNQVSKLEVSQDK